MAKIFPGASAFGWWPPVARSAVAGGLALPPRRILVTVASAFLVVGAAAWTLAVAQAVVGNRASRLPSLEPVAFQPSQFVSAELSVGYLGR